MNIKILGSGCANCKRLEQITRKVIEQQGIQAEIEKVTNMVDIMEWPILSTPGLVIENNLVASGRIPTEAEITEWVRAAI
jgi:small redox-active disulfide protein 2